jgi:ubiquinol-cytochrome c reductase cytochrome b subunit
MPVLIGIMLLIIPILNNRGERAASRRPWAIAVVLLSVIMIGSLWIAGQQSPWSPNFEAPPLPEKVIGASSGPVFEGAQLFHAKACLSCHLIQGHGGRRGPDLTYIADTLTRDNIIIRIVNGGGNMPAFGNSLKPQELDALVAFLESRKRPLRPQDRP